MAKHDSIVAKKLRENPRNATYLSPQIQNELLRCVGSTLRKFISDEIAENKLFEISIDESKDVSKQEQLSVVLRYVDSTGETRERFLQFVDVDDLTANGLKNSVCRALASNSIDILNCVSQTYDGASVMSGQYNGVQAKIREIAPLALYTHCFAHRRNLVLVNATKSAEGVKEFFELLQSLYAYMSSSNSHQVFLKCQRDKGLTPIRTLKRLSDTRWSCRLHSIQAIRTKYSAIIGALKELQIGNNDRSMIASGLLTRVSQCSFIVYLAVFDILLSVSNGLSNVLQAKSIDFVRAVSLVEATKMTFNQFLNEESKWEVIWKDALKAAEEFEIPVNVSKRKRQLNSRLDEFFVTESTGGRLDGAQYSSDSRKFRLNVFIPIIDAIQLEMSQRFTDSSNKLIRSLEFFDPSKADYLNLSVAETFFSHYQLDKNAITSEVLVFKNFVSERGESLQTMDSINKELSSIDAAFPKLREAFRIATTIGVSSASCERTFSCMKLLKTDLRSTMGEERLNDLAIISIEEELISQLNYDAIIDKFSDRDGGRRICLFK